LKLLSFKNGKKSTQRAVSLAIADGGGQISPPISPQGVID
jgi:hypothetical protein